MAQRTDAVCESDELKERRRCVGVVLRAVGHARLDGDQVLADALDRVATELEHPETRGVKEGRR